MAELADALDLGSSVPDVQVQVLSSALISHTSVCEIFFFSLAVISIAIFTKQIIQLLVFGVCNRLAIAGKMSVIVIWY